MIFHSVSMEKIKDLFTHKRNCPIYIRERKSGGTVGEKYLIYVQMISKRINCGIVMK